MRESVALSTRRALISVLLAGVLLIALVPAQTLAQGGDQPVFQAATYASSDGSTSIQSQEAQLTAEFLAGAGTLE